MENLDDSKERDINIINESTNYLNENVSDPTNEIIPNIKDECNNVITIRDEN